jgi:DNA helicase-2/ATP-dependent DNA helicase PcrA
MKRLSARTRNLCVVGDDDQSIYRWRGADVRNIRGFRKDFPDAKVVKLEQNYRSTKNIVTSALAVIAPSPTREPKELWTDNEDGGPVRYVSLSTTHYTSALAHKLVCIGLYCVSVGHGTSNHPDQPGQGGEKRTHRTDGQA